MGYRYKFGSKKREALWLAECLAAYKAERTDGKSCICNLCDTPVLASDAWDESHDPARAKAFGGKSVGIAHRLCNRRHGSQVVKRQVAKSDRIRRRHIGALRPGLGEHAMPCGTRSSFKRTVGGRVVARLTLADKERRFKAKRGILYRPEA